MKVGGGVRRGTVGEAVRVEAEVSVGGGGGGTVWVGVRVGEGATVGDVVGALSDEAERLAVKVGLAVVIVMAGDVTSLVAGRPVGARG